MLTVPPENCLAAFPPTVTVGLLTLYPMTIAHAIALETLGVSLEQTSVPAKSVPLAALVLSSRIARDPASYSSRDFRRVLRAIRGDLGAAGAAVDEICRVAFATFIRAARQPTASDGVVRKTIGPHGLGWPLETAAALCEIYGWSWTDAMQTPLCTAGALLAASRQLNGGKHSGLDYLQREYQRQVRDRKNDLDRGRRRCYTTEHE